MMIMTYRRSKKKIGYMSELVFDRQASKNSWCSLAFFSTPFTETTFKYCLWIIMKQHGTTANTNKLIQAVRMQMTSQKSQKVSFCTIRTEIMAPSPISRHPSSRNRIRTTPYLFGCRNFRAILISRPYILFAGYQLSQTFLNALFNSILTRTKIANASIIKNRAPSSCQQFDESQPDSANLETSSPDESTWIANESVSRNSLIQLSKSAVGMNSSEHICKIIIITISAFSGQSSLNKTVSTTIQRVLIRVQRYCSMPALKRLTKMFALKKAFSVLSAYFVSSAIQSLRPGSTIGLTFQLN